MQDRKPYWTDHPAYCAHYPLASLKHETGDWEMFRVTYKPGLNYEGGDYTEFYWNGDLQEDFAEDGPPVTNPKEMLEQFVEFWTDENRG